MHLYIYSKSNKIPLFEISSLATTNYDLTVGSIMFKYSMRSCQPLRYIKGKIPIVPGIKPMNYNIVTYMGAPIFPPIFTVGIV